MSKTLGGSGLTTTIQTYSCAPVARRRSAMRPQKLKIESTKCHPGIEFAATTSGLSHVVHIHHPVCRLSGQGLQIIRRSHWIGTNASMDPSKIPLSRPPPGTTSNFVDPPDLTPNVIACHTILLFFTTVCVFIRLYTRKIIQKRVGFDECKSRLACAPSCKRILIFAKTFASYPG